jgi:hypothetical protein
MAREIIDDPFANLDRSEARKVTGKTATLAGQYLRRTFTFTPGQLEKVREIAEELSLSEMDVMRWFTNMGIDAFLEGARPEVRETAVKARLKSKDW